jgi:hypothetical protein
LAGAKRFCDNAPRGLLAVESGMFVSSGNSGFSVATGKSHNVVKNDVVGAMPIILTGFVIGSFRQKFLEI